MALALLISPNEMKENDLKHGLQWFQLVISRINKHVYKISKKKQVEGNV